MLDSEELRKERSRNMSAIFSDSSTITLKRCKEDLRIYLNDKISEMDSQGKYDREQSDAIYTRIIDEWLNETSPKVEGFFENGKLEIEKLRVALINSLMKYGIMESIINDDSISEIQINDWNSIIIEKSGDKQFAKHPTTGEPLKFENMDDYLQFVNKILYEDLKKIDDQNGLIDSISKDGYRIAVQGWSASVADKTGDFRYHPVTMQIRKQRSKVFKAKEMVEGKSAGNEMVKLLRMIVASKSSTFVGGGTGSGKTVWLQIMADMTDSLMRISAMGSPAELRLRKRDSSGVMINNVIHMESKEWTQEKMAPKEFPTIDNVARANLRATPDLIIYEEIRSANEFEFTVSAALTGHFFLTSLHIEGAEGLLSRYIVEYTKAARVPRNVVVDSLANFLKFVVVATKLADGKRVLKEIVEVEGAYTDQNGEYSLKLNPIFQFIRADEEYEGEIDNMKASELKRKVVGAHYRVGCISSKMVARMKDAGFYSKHLEFLTKPLERDSENNIIGEPCSYVYKPLFADEE